MINFGIFRRLADKHGELLLEFDHDEVFVDLLEHLHKNLPELPKKEKFYHADPRGWTTAEISTAFTAAWRQVCAKLKRETIRIP